MNKFILIYTKEELHIDISNVDKKIDSWNKKANDGVIQAIKELKESRFEKNTFVIGYEARNCQYSDKDLENIVFICGDPYKMESESSEDILNIISNQNPKEIYGKVSGAYSWISFDNNEQTIEVNTDFFGQMPVYYYDDGKVFAVASSIKILLEALPFISRKVDIDEILKFIVGGDINDYYKPFFKSINRLQGHQCLKYEKKNDNISIKNISSLDDFRNITYPFSSNGLKDDLALVMKAAAPNAAYMLSGGVDSTLLAAVGASMSNKPIDCYTASTGYGKDLLYSKKAAKYMKALLFEVELNYDAKLLDYIEELTIEYGSPVPIWGNTVGSALIGDRVKRDGFDILINGSAEDHVVGGVYVPTVINYIHYYTDKKKWKNLFSLLKFNYKRGLVPSRKVLQEILKVFFQCNNQDVVSTYKFIGKDSSNFFSKKIQDIRNKLEKHETCFINPENRVKDYMLGRMQKFVLQAYMGGVLSDINVRLPFLDARLIKYMDLNDETLFAAGLSKQFARDAMKGIMDDSVINREDNEGLRWRSTVLLKKNKNQIINEIKQSKFLKQILSEKTLESLDKRIFRKSLLLSLYSVALFDKKFRITLA
jgi:asparagine synthetase B (glutamine-hydrolysing)